MVNFSLFDKYLWLTIQFKKRQETLTLSLKNHHNPPFSDKSLRFNGHTIVSHIFLQLISDVSHKFCLWNIILVIGNVNLKYELSISNQNSANYINLNACMSATWPCQPQTFTHLKVV